MFHDIVLTLWISFLFSGSTQVLSSYAAPNFDLSLLQFLLFIACTQEGKLLKLAPIKEKV